MIQTSMLLSSDPVIELPGAQIDYFPEFVSPDKADWYLTYLRDHMPWEQPVIRLFGKRIASPRLAHWCADNGVDYRYSGLVHQGTGWDTHLEQLRDCLSESTGHEFNSCLLNYYRDGQDAMGWHSDDERELGESPVIASVSLGATRLFELKSKRTVTSDLHSVPTGATTKIPLTSGSLLLMSGETQRHYKHRVNRDRRVIDSRINLTFRRIVD